MVAFPSAFDRNEVVISSVAWPVVEGELTDDLIWPTLHGNANNCGMAFEDDFMSNVAINKDIVPMQCLSRSKAHAKAELIVKVCKDLGLVWIS